MIAPTASQAPPLSADMGVAASSVQHSSHGTTSDISLAIRRQLCYIGDRTDRCLAAAFCGHMVSLFEPRFPIGKEWFHVQKSDRISAQRHDPSALYDAYNESDDTEEHAKSGFLPPVGGKTR